MSLSGQVFAEIPAVLLVALGLWAALDLRAGMSTLALLVTLVLLPWLHPKFIAVAIALLVSTAILQRDRASAAAVAGALCPRGISPRPRRLLVRDLWIGPARWSDRGGFVSSGRGLGRAGWQPRRSVWLASCSINRVVC